MSIINLLNPQTLDLDAFIKANPFIPGQRLKKDSLVFIIHSLIVRGASIDDEHLEKLGKREYFIPLNAEVLKSKISYYHNHLEYLKKVGIIECDESYIAGTISKGYRLASPYRGVDFKKVAITDFTLVRKIKADNPFSNSNRAFKEFPYLAKWFAAKKLQIDEVAAYDWINNYEAAEISKLNNNTMSSPKRYKEKIKLNEKCKNFKILVNRIVEHDYFFKVDNTGNRLHTNLTNLPKGLREFVTYDKKPLVSIDIKNSQPYMSTAILNKEFWQSRELPQKPTLKRLDNKLYSNIRENKRRFNSIIMFLHSSETLYRTDLQIVKFIKSVANGTFYEELITLFDRHKVFKVGMTNEEKRNKAKSLVFTLFFDDPNKIYNRNVNSIYNVFKHNFPVVTKVFEFVKTNNYRNLAIILQKIESYLLLNRVCSVISRENPDIPLFTIHDSIITTLGNEQYVQSVLESELIKGLGFPPKLSIESWESREIKKSVGVI